jgi:FkbM family methyltransferase
MKTKQKIFLAKLVTKFISIIYKRNEVLVRRNGINWNLDLKEGIDLSIFLFGNFEKSIASMAGEIMKSRNLDIIDIGANMGVHSINLSNIYKNIKVYSIEPTNFGYKKLIKNLSLNSNLKNVYPSQLFITKLLKKAPPLYSSWELTSKIKQKHKKHLGTKKSSSKARSISLDNFVKKNKIFKKTLIKCDVDGNELDVFKSGFNYLKKYKPFIIMELAPYLYPENGYNYSILLDYLKKFNYKFYDGLSFKKISNIYDYAKSIRDGESVNIFLK